MKHALVWIACVAFAALADEPKHVGGATPWVSVTSNAPPAKQPATQPAHASTPVVKDGLELTVAPAKAVFPVGEVRLVASLRNVSDKIIRLYEQKQQWARPELHVVIRDRNAPTSYSLLLNQPGKNVVWVLRSLKPGESMRMDLASDRVIDNSWAGEDKPGVNSPKVGPLPAGDYEFTVTLGLVDFATIRVAAAQYAAEARAAAALGRDAVAVPALPEQADVWSGQITSAVARFSVADPGAAERAAYLKAHTDSFLLSVMHHFELGGKHVGVGLGVFTSPRGTFKGNVATAALTNAEILRIIDHLAESGFLAQAKEREGQPPAKPALPSYELIVRRHEGRSFSLNLGWGLPMLAKLDAIRGLMAGRPAELMDRILKEREADRKAWLAEAATRPADGGITQDKAEAIALEAILAYFKDDPIRQKTLRVSVPMKKVVEGGKTCWLVEYFGSNGKAKVASWTQVRVDAQTGAATIRPTPGRFGA